MRSLFKGALSVLIALCLLLTSTLAPASAYAYGLNGLGSSSTHSVSPLNVKGNHNTIVVKNSLRNEDYARKKLNGFVDSMIDGAFQTAGYAAGAVIVCYTAGGLASTVFPPAAALAPACSAIPVMAAGAKGGQVVVRGLQAIAK